MRTQFVDCRWELGKPERGRELYLESHIPGASFLDLDRDLSAPASVPGGRHPLPRAEEFARAASRAGIGTDTLVVAYDQGMSGGAARLWWLLRHFGHEQVAVFAGGIGAWLGPLARHEEHVEPAQFEPRERQGDTVDAPELLDRIGDESLLLLDARAPERYRGEVEPVDRVAGHIPGARNLPARTAFSPPGEVLAAPEIVAYCGSGVSACVLLLALAQAGRPDARLYVGSWSDWSSRGFPAEVG